MLDDGLFHICSCVISHANLRKIIEKRCIYLQIYCFKQGTLYHKHSRIYKKKRVQQIIFICCTRLNLLYQLVIVGA